MKKTLIVLAHPDMSQSRLNKALIEAIKEEGNITIHDLYATYKTPEEIDVSKEQQLLLDHDRIVFQFPLYWFSTPGMLKYWQDMVLEYGFAYGSEGNALAGKAFKIATTAGAAQEAYESAGKMHVSMAEILKPLETTALFTQMKFTPSFILYGALEMTDDILSEKAQEYKTLLTSDNWEN